MLTVAGPSQVRSIAGNSQGDGCELGVELSPVSVAAQLYAAYIPQ